MSQSVKHFFEVDLPLPLARRLAVERLVPPERVQQARAALHRLVPAFTLCRLTEQERGQVEVPPLEDSWYRLGRSHQLHQYGYLLKHHPHVSAVPEQAMEEISACCSALGSLETMTKFLSQTRERGMLVAELLITRGVWRIEQAVKARLAELPVRRRKELRLLWEPIGALRELPPVEVPLCEASSADPGEAPRDLSALAEQVRSERLADLRPFIQLYCDLGVPELPEEEQEKLEQDIDPHAVAMARACADGLLQAEPALIEHSGVRPESLRLLLGWFQEFHLLDQVVAQMLQDIDDTDRLVWRRGRELVQKVQRDCLVRAHETSLGRGERDMLIFELSFTMREARIKPPPEVIRQQVQRKRERAERRIQGLIEDDLRE